MTRLRTHRHCATSLSVLCVLALGTALTAQNPLVFDVSSIKRNLGTTAGGEQRLLPDGTFSATNISIRNLLTLAWPTGDSELRSAAQDW